jgi:methyl-accepting chemotaxis protein
VGGRLGVAFAVVTAMIAVAAGTGAWGMRQHSAIQGRIDQLERVHDDLQEMKYLAADVTGWQGLMLADAGAYGNAKATGDDSYNRKGELSDKASIYELLDSARTADMTQSERELWNQLRPAWDGFFTWDATLMEWLKDDTQAARAKVMDNVNGGEAADAYGVVLDISDKLSTSVSARIAAMSDEAESVRRTGYIVLAVTLGAALLLAVALGVRTTRKITRPLKVVVAALGGLAGGDLTVRADLHGQDELATLGRALDNTIDGLRGMITTLAANAGSMSAATAQLAGNAGDIAATARKTSSRADLVATGADQVSSNVQIVAAGSEEMSASIAEIARNASDAAHVAAAAVAKAESTNATVARLGTSSDEIGNVVRTITSIAEQTNLLALNATIEAARAGEAGKGFAVVATEVKDLAQETARATDDIAQRVAAIQSDTSDAVEAIMEIASIIGRISDYQTVIAAAVDEQTATTSEMRRNVTEAATASGDIAENIGGVAEAATHTAEGAIESQDAVSELARLGEQLTATVGTFRL